MSNYMWCCLTMSYTWIVLVHDFHCLCCCCGCLYISPPPLQSAPIPSFPLISYIFCKRLPQFPLRPIKDLKKKEVKTQWGEQNIENTMFKGKTIGIRWLLKDCYTFIIVAIVLCKILYKETHRATDLTEGLFISHKHVMWQAILLWSWDSYCFSSLIHLVKRHLIHRPYDVNRGKMPKNLSVIQPQGDIITISTIKGALCDFFLFHLQFCYII